MNCQSFRHIIHLLSSSVPRWHIHIYTHTLFLPFGPFRHLSSAICPLLHSIQSHTHKPTQHEGPEMDLINENQFLSLTFSPSIFNIWFILVSSSIYQWLKSMKHTQRDAIINNRPYLSKLLLKTYRCVQKQSMTPKHFI